jgi:hypothetical protein
LGPLSFCGHIIYRWSPEGTTRAGAPTITHELRFGGYVEKQLLTLPPKQSDLVDPDFFGTLIVVLDTLASIGAFANEWMKLRENLKNRRLAQSYLTYREVLRNIRRAHDDLFVELSEVLDIFAIAENRSLKALRSQPLGWGKCNYDFSRDEFNHLRSKLEKIELQYASIKDGCLLMLGILTSIQYPGEQAITENLEDFNERLNDVLFKSESVGIALEKVERLKARTTTFLNQLQSLGN